jgi:uncharacterized protein with HEPN domain
MPLRDKRSYLWDILEASRAILTFTEGKSFADYQANQMLRRAVERDFTIIGEAFTQARRFFPETPWNISNIGKIIGFCNQLVHAYMVIDDEAVWGTIKNDLPLLISEVEALLEAENRK